MAENRKSLLPRLREAVTPPQEEKRSFDPTLIYPFRPTTSGVVLSEEGALAVSAVYACINKISSTIASLALGLYEVQEDGKREDKTHIAYQLITREPNMYMGAYHFWVHIVSDALMHGGGYALIDRDANGRPKSLTLVPPDQTKAKDLNGRRIYLYRDSDEALFNDDVLAIECFRGISPIQEHLENLWIT